MIYGIDVSEFVGDVDPVVLASGGCKFASVKCSDAALKNGTWFPFLDKKHQYFSDKLRQGHIPTSSYAFGHPSMDMKTHADFFIAHCYSDQLLTVLDMESLSTTYINGKPVQTVPDSAGEWTKSWLDYVAAELGEGTMLYSGSYYLSVMLKQCPALSTVKKWIAEYHDDGTTQTLPKAAKTDPSVVAWQFQGDVKLAGVTGLVDRDVVFADDLTPLYVQDPQL